MMLPILITSSVIPNDPQSVVLNSYELRKKYTIEAILQWKKIAPHNPIIICDGSNYNFKQCLQEKNLNLTNFEFLFFQNENDKVKHFGKGYGESEIIKYAINSSFFLKEYKFFAKCTAKLWVENFTEISKNFFNYPCILNPHIIRKNFVPHIDYIDTRFYVFNTEFYKENFFSLYQNINKPISIEHLFLIQFHKLNLEKIFFDKPPIISGISGGSGKIYNTKYYRVLKDRVKYFFFKRNRQLNKLFV